jgi:hypothetical protein
MGTKNVLTKEEVKYSGVLDFKGMYSFASDWIKDGDYGLSEKSYSEKVKGDAKNIEIVWSASRKLNDYYKSHIDIKWTLSGLKDVEVEIDGKKKTMNKVTNMKIALKGSLESDYDNKWSGSSTKNFMKGVFEKYVNPAKKDKMGSEVNDFVVDLKNELKAFLELTGKY